MPYAFRTIYVLNVPLVNGVDQWSSASGSSRFEVSRSDDQKLDIVLQHNKKAWKAAQANIVEIEALFPLWIEVDSHGFLLEKGDKITINLLLQVPVLSPQQ